VSGERGMESGELRLWTKKGKKKLKINQKMDEGVPNFGCNQSRFEVKVDENLKNIC